MHCGAKMRNNFTITKIPQQNVGRESKFAKKKKNRQKKIAKKKFAKKNRQKKKWIVARNLFDIPFIAQNRINNIIIRKQKKIPKMSLATSNFVLTTRRMSNKIISQHTSCVSKICIPPLLSPEFFFSPKKKSPRNSPKKSQKKQKTKFWRIRFFWRIFWRIEFFWRIVWRIEFFWRIFWRIEFFWRIFWRIEFFANFGQLGSILELGWILGSIGVH